MTITRNILTYEEKQVYRNFKIFYSCSASDPLQENKAIKPNCHQETL